MGIRGSYPGGPRRGDAERVGKERAPGAPRLRRAEDVEARLAAGGSALRRRRRSKRVLSGFVVAMIVAGGVGLYLGYRTHRSSEDITDERNTAQQKAEFDPSFTTNRILDELWKMEMKQRQPQAP